MIEVDQVSKKIRELEDRACNVEQECIALFSDIILNYIDEFINRWEILNQNQIKTQRKILRNYQEYYHPAFFFISQYLPEKKSELESFYDNPHKYPYGVLNYIQFSLPRNPNTNEEYIQQFQIVFERQRSLLLSIPSIIEIQEYDIRKLISKSFINSEIDEADILFANDHWRAAGSLAGVAFERKLRVMCDKAGINHSNNDQINSLIEKLHNNKQIQKEERSLYEYMGKIRNQCSHAGEEPKKEVVDRLIRLCKEIIL